MSSTFDCSKESTPLCGWKWHSMSFAMALDFDTQKIVLALRCSTLRSVALHDVALHCVLVCACHECVSTRQSARKFNTQSPSSPATYQATLHCTKPTESGSLESACTSRMPVADNLSRDLGKSSDPRPASSKKSLNLLSVREHSVTRGGAEKRRE